MRFSSIASPHKAVSFREALFAGLAPDGGLFHPIERPDLKQLFSSLADAESGAGARFMDLAESVLASLLAPEVNAASARRIVKRAFSFEPVLRRLDGQVLLLELFHGPTCAFKDFGAQFLAASMEEMLRDAKGRIQILVATSGDTGSAVAHAFHGRRNIDVVILYPSGRVSDLQEKQLTTLGGNVHALEIQGSFDDCQRLAKEAFRDRELGKRLSLTSANSINIGRLLPQSLYYIYAATRGDMLGGAAPTICVPSGNFGNLTAGVYAWAWGLAVRGFIAATNANDIVPAYLRTGLFSPAPSLATLSNAMDVGNPSNFERLERIFGQDWKNMGRTIRGASIDDERTREGMREVRARYGLFIDPHTAVGYMAARDWLSGKDGTGAGPAVDAAAGSGPSQVIVLSTAHPGKFSEIVREATGEDPEIPERLAECLTLPKRSRKMGTALPELSRFLLDSFA